MFHPSWDWGLGIGDRGSGIRIQGPGRGDEREELRVESEELAPWLRASRSSPFPARLAPGLLQESDRGSGIGDFVIRKFLIRHFLRRSMFPPSDLSEPSRALTQCHAAGRLCFMKVRTVSFEALQRDKRRARKRDELRLARGEVTPEQFEAETSRIPTDAKITIPDFCETIERLYGR